jgi:hypothetical protein
MWEFRYEVYGDNINRNPMLAIREGRWKLLQARMIILAEREEVASFIW